LLSFFCSIAIWYEVGLLCDVWIGAKIATIAGTIVYPPLWFEAGSLNLTWSLYVDGKAAPMLVTVTGVSTLVHLFSTCYVFSDPAWPLFVSFLSLFTGFMLVLVTADNLVVMLVGWEGIGVCSYVLICFWFTRLSATKSALKAILVNRVGDGMLMWAVLAVWWYTGSAGIGVTWFHPPQYLRIDAMRVDVDWVCLAFVLGAMGKSAQIGFHVWLADAMEGPTPVSALIHAATLVTAGVYVIALTPALWSKSPLCYTLLALVGSLTLVMAAAIGLCQNDSKRVIAYSTCSQLGYMMASCALGHYALAVSHLMTHACLKAALFLSAGFVIHANASHQDLRRYGGLLCPAGTIVASASLAGWPLLSGFYTKDGILEVSWTAMHPVADIANTGMLLVVCLTSSYSLKLCWNTFITDASQRS